MESHPPVRWVEGEHLPAIRARRVELRWLEDSDADDLFRIYSDPEAMAYWSTPPMRERVEAQSLIDDIRRKFAEHSLYEWGVVRLSDARMIGTLTFSSLDPRNRRAEIGFALARDVWRQGYMREGVTAGLGFAFETMNLLRIEADVDPRNVASLRLLESVGFVREGLLRERWHVGGQAQDSVILGLLRREWVTRP